MFLHKSNIIFRSAYPNFLWRMPNNEKKIYLTFDDGPIPEITEFVLETLETYNAKATFFCIGDNIEKHSGIFQKILEQNHGVGNHTFNHLNGWKTEQGIYLKNVSLCQEEIQKQIQSQNQIQSQIEKQIDSYLIPHTSYLQFFRPPYGRISRTQAKEILKMHQIVMWDVLTGDFSPALSPDLVLEKSLKYTENGSIVVFHDSLKAAKNMQFTLPRFLQHFAEKGFEFVAL